MNVVSYTVRAVTKAGEMHKAVAAPDNFQAALYQCANSIQFGYERVTITEEYEDGSVCDLFVFDINGVWPDNPRKT